MKSAHSSLYTALIIVITGRVSAAEPADAIRNPEERAAFAAIAARFESAPAATKTKGTTTIKMDGLKGRKPAGGTCSVTVDAAGHIVNVTSNVADFTNEEFKLFAAFPELTSLTLWHNGKIDAKAITSPCDGTGLVHLKDLKKLTKLTLAGGALNDAGMAEAAKLPALAELHIWHASFTDAGVAAFRNHPRLEVVKIGPMWTNDLTDKSLEALAGCPKLRHIQIAETHLTWDGGLKHLAEKPGSLAIVDLKNCLIEPAEVEKLRAALPKVKVEWEGLAAIGTHLAGNNFGRNRAAKWMPKDLLARALGAGSKSKP
jgi:hypothetical protein